MEFHFEQLTVWQEAMKLVTATYEAAERFPKTERFGIGDQLRRAEFVQFLYMARGSLYETITLIKSATSLGYFPLKAQEELLLHCKHIASQLSGLINSLKIQ